MSLFNPRNTLNRKAYTLDDVTQTDKKYRLCLNLLLPASRGFSDPFVNISIRNQLRSIDILYSDVLVPRQEKQCATQLAVRYGWASQFSDVHSEFGIKISFLIWHNNRFCWHAACHAHTKQRNVSPVELRENVTCHTSQTPRYKRQDNELVIRLMSNFENLGICLRFASHWS